MRMATLAAVIRYGPPRLKAAGHEHASTYLLARLMFFQHWTWRRRAPLSRSLHVRFPLMGFHHRGEKCACQVRQNRHAAQLGKGLTSVSSILAAEPGALTISAGYGRGQADSMGFR